MLAYSRKRQQKFLLSKENYLRTRPFQCQHRFGTFQSVMEFRSFLEKNRGVPQIARKISCWVVGVGARTKREKEVSPKIRHLSKYYEIVVFPL